MQKRFWSSEKLLSLSAVLVSVCTLIVFTYQTNLIQTQQYMSVYPHLGLSNTRSGSLEYQYILINNGIGPAMIQSIDITVGDESYETLIEYVENQLSESDSVYVGESGLFPGRLVQAKESIPLIFLIDNEMLDLYGVENTLSSAHRLREILNSDSLSIKIRYESIYGESWTISNNDYIPIKD